MAKRKPKAGEVVPTADGGYDGLLSGAAALIEQSRRAAARIVNGLMTATDYELGRRIVEFEQGGKERADYGEGCSSGSGPTCPSGSAAATAGGTCSRCGPST